MSKSMDNCITQCHLNLTSEHKKILLHQYYMLRYLERTPASYTPCTDITLFTAVNLTSAPYRICIPAVPYCMACDTDLTLRMRF